MNIPFHSGINLLPLQVLIPLFDLLMYELDVLLSKPIHCHWFPVRPIVLLVVLLSPLLVRHAPLSGRPAEFHIHFQFMFLHALQYLVFLFLSGLHARLSLVLIYLELLPPQVLILNDLLTNPLTTHSSLLLPKIADVVFLRENNP